MIINHYRLIMMTARDNVSHKSLLLLQQQRRHIYHHQQMMKRMMMRMMRMIMTRNRRQQHGSMDATYPRQLLDPGMLRRHVVVRSDVNDHGSIITQDSNSLDPTEKKDDVDVEVNDDALQTKVLSSSTALGKRNRIDSDDYDDVIDIDTAAAKNITMTFPSSSSSYNVDDNETLLASQYIRIAFYRHIQRKLRQANMTLNRIGARTIHYEVQCVLDGLHQLIASYNDDDDDEIMILPDQSLSSDSYTNPADNIIQSHHHCKKRKIHRAAAGDSKTISTSSSSSSNIRTTNHIVPDLIQSNHHHHDDDEVTVPQNVKEECNHDTESSFCHDDNKLLLVSSILRRKQQQQQRMLLYKRAYRMKQISMSFRCMNTYQCILYWEIQSCIDQVSIDQS